MTQQKNENTYFFYLCKKGETTIPLEITITSTQPKERSKVTPLAYKNLVNGKKWNMNLR